MKCKLCLEDKLSREFPPEPESSNCDHPQLACLECVIEGVKTNGGMCPYTGCNQRMKQEQLKECEDILEYLFPPFIMNAPIPAAAPSSESGTTAQLYVTTMTGEREAFLFDEKKSIRTLKKEIKEKMKVEPNKQRLVYNGNEIKTCDPTGKDLSLKDVNIQACATIHLMVVLYEIPEDLNHVIFELSWKFPGLKRDFLDASCFMFMNDVHYSWVDWREMESYEGLRHFGDGEVDDVNGTGAQKIEAYLKDIPKCVSHLIFTLSSFRAPTITAFRDPQLKFYNANDPTTSLTNYSFDRSLNTQAVIVCCVSRKEDGNWTIWESGHLSAGNGYNFRPLIKEIQSLIRDKKFIGISLEAGKSRIRDMTAEELKEFEKKCLKR